MDEFVVLSFLDSVMKSTGPYPVTYIHVKQLLQQRFGIESVTRVKTKIQERLRYYATLRQCNNTAEKSSTDEVPAALGAKATSNPAVSAPRPLPFNTYIPSTPIREKLVRHYKHHNYSYNDQSKILATGHSMKEVVTKVILLDFDGPVAAPHHLATVNGEQFRACGGYKYQFRQNPHAFNLMDPIVLVTNLGILIAVLKVLERIPGVRVVPGSQRCTWGQSPVPMLKASYEQMYTFFNDVLGPDRAVLKRADGDILADGVTGDDVNGDKGPLMARVKHLPGCERVPPHRICLVDDSLVYREPAKKHGYRFILCSRKPMDAVIRLRKRDISSQEALGKPTIAMREASSQLRGPVPPTPDAQPSLRSGLRVAARYRGLAPKSNNRVHHEALTGGQPDTQVPASPSVAKLKGKILRSQSYSCLDPYFAATVMATDSSSDLVSVKFDGDSVHDSAYLFEMMLFAVEDHPTWDIRTLRAEIQAVQREISQQIDLDSKFAAYCGLDKSGGEKPTVPLRRSPMRTKDYIITAAIATNLHGVARLASRETGQPEVCEDYPRLVHVMSAPCRCDEHLLDMPSATTTLELMSAIAAQPSVGAEEKSDGDGDGDGDGASSSHPDPTHADDTSASATTPTPAASAASSEPTPSASSDEEERAFVVTSLPEGTVVEVLDDESVQNQPTSADYFVRIGPVNMAHLWKRKFGFVSVRRLMDFTSRKREKAFVVM